ncbi:MAG: bifunctional oligoribonuclease/PAP phosphatase NrnA [Thermoanaerobaculia bacterium]
MTIEDVLPPLAAARRILLTSHQSPDGDAIGTELGLARILRGAGREVAIWNDHPVPPAYRRMPGADQIHSGPTPPPGFPAAFDLAVVLECPTLDRSGLEKELVQVPLLNIDHHLGNPGYGVAAWVDTEAPAVAVLIAEMARRLSWEIDLLAASCLLVGLTTDTGGFRFSNATPRAFEAAAALVRDGASPELVSQWIYESQSEGSVRLLGELLRTLSLHEAGSVATVVLTREMFDRAGAAAGDSEGLVDVPRSIAGVEAVALLREVGDGAFKVSLRSRGAVDVQSIARRYEGGGHRNAAGCRALGALDELRIRFATELAEAVEASRGV